MSDSSVDLITRSTHRKHQSHGEPLAAYQPIHQLKKYMSARAHVALGAESSPDGERQYIRM